MTLEKQPDMWYDLPEYRVLFHIIIERGPYSDGKKKRCARPRPAGGGVATGRRPLYVSLDGSERRATHDFSLKLVETDRLPPGKRDSPALRTREQTIRRDIEDGIHSGKECTLDQAVERYLALRQDLRPNTMVSYRRF